MQIRTQRIVPRLGAAASVLALVSGGAVVAIPGSAAAQQAAPARTGRITGRVVDAQTGAGLTSVGVQVVGTTVGGMTGLDGRFTINGVPAGTVSLTVRRIGYQAKTVTGVAVAADGAVEQNIAMQTASVQLSAQVVTASAERGTVSEALDQQRRATGIVTSVTAEQISRSPDSDAAQAVQRVSGVTVQDGRFVSVRGLGERYTTTSLNGARLPSPEPERRVVPLDIFPSGLLQNISTIKTFTPDQPGDFSGAVVDIRTREFPARRQLTYSVSAGANTAATGKSLVSSPREGLEWLGFAGTERDRPRGLRLVDRGVATQPQQNQIIDGMRNVWSPTGDRGLPNGSMSASLGGNDPVFGQRVGYLLSGTYSTSQEVRANERLAVVQPQDISAGRFSELYRFDGQTGRSSVLWGGVFNASTLIGRNTRVSVNNTYNRSADNEARVDVGRSENLNLDLERQTLRFIERSIRSNQLLVEQQLGRRQSLDLALTSSGVTRDEPDRSDVVYAFEQTPSGGRGARFLAFEGDAAPRRTYSELDEVNWTGAANYKFEVGPRAVLRAGGLFRATQRDAENVQYGITGFLPDAALRAPIETIFDGRYTQPGQGSLLITPLGFGGSYFAEEQLGAGYVMGEWSATQRLRLTGGARVERAEIDVRTRILGGSRIEAELRNTDVLPSLVANFQLRENQALRASATQTLARPEYRELSPTLFREVLGGVNVYGNPDLKRSLIQNFDLKWEAYPSAGEVLSVGVFAKNFQDPIERVQVTSTGAPQATFRNADGARNYGVEVEARKQLGFLGAALAPFQGFANVTVMRSEINLTPEQQQALTNSKRPLVGQAPWVLNTGLTYASGSGGTTATLLYNVVGERVTAAGVGGLPDVHDQPRHVVDLSVRFPLVRALSARIDGRNLLDARYRQQQGGITVEEYTVGRVFSAGLTWRP